MIPLILEVGYFGVPVINFVWDSIEGHDPPHEQDRDSSSKEANEDIVVCNASVGGVTLKGQDVTLKRWRELPIFLCHVMGREPGNGISGSILILKGFLEFSKEVIPGSEGYSGADEGIFLEGISPGQGGPFSHVGEHKHDFLYISIIGFLIDSKIKLNGVYPQDSSFIGMLRPVLLQR